MPTLAIYANDSVKVTDIFGTFMVLIKMWADDAFKIKAEVDDIDEPHDTDDSPESGTDPPTLAINVNDSVDTQDIFGK